MNGAGRLSAIPHFKKWLRQHETDCPHCRELAPARCAIGKIIAAQLDATEKAAQFVRDRDAAWAQAAAR